MGDLGYIPISVFFLLFGVPPIVAAIIISFVAGVIGRYMLDKDVSLFSTARAYCVYLLVSWLLIAWIEASLTNSSTADQVGLIFLLLNVGALALAAYLTHKQPISRALFRQD